MGVGDAFLVGLGALLFIAALILLIAHKHIRSWKFGVFFESRRWSDPMSSFEDDEVDGPEA